MSGRKQLLRIIAMAIFAAGSLTSAPAGEALSDGVDPATGFRMERYRAPVPDVLPGGTVLDTASLKMMLATGNAVLIDVYPPKGAGPDPLDGNWRNSEVRENITGSTWLPEVGRGHLEPELEAYFRRNLELITNANTDRPLIFYCTADCWQGWNAARRAIVWGHTHVSWYPGGTDQWREDGGETVIGEPVNFLEEVK